MRMTGFTIQKDGTRTPGWRPQLGVWIKMVETGSRENFEKGFEMGEHEKAARRKAEKAEKENKTIKPRGWRSRKAKEEARQRGKSRGK